MLSALFKNGIALYCAHTSLDIAFGGEISSIVFNGGTEDEIKALENPSNKLYMSSDTFKLLYFDPQSLT